MSEVWMQDNEIVKDDVELVYSKSEKDDIKYIEERLANMTVEEFKKIVVRAGIYTEDMKLRKAYGGTVE